MARRGRIPKARGAERIKQELANMNSGETTQKKATCEFCDDTGEFYEFNETKLEPIKCNMCDINKEYFKILKTQRTFKSSKYDI